MKKLYSVTEAKELFSIKKGLGINLTKTLMQLNNMVYNSNLKVSEVPGDEAFLFNLLKELEAKLPNHSFIKAIKAARSVFPSGDSRQLGLFLKLASGNANNHCIGNLETSRICQVLAKAYDEALHSGDVVVIPPRYPWSKAEGHPYKVGDIQEKCYEVKDKTYAKLTQLCLDLNELNTEDSINDKMRSLNILDKPVKLPPVVIDKSDPDKDLVYKSNVGLMNLTNNPFLIAKWLMHQVETGLSKKAAIGILTSISDTNPNFRSDEFSEIVFGEIMILIPLKEYIQLLKSAK